MNPMVAAPEWLGEFTAREVKAQVGDDGVSVTVGKVTLRLREGQLPPGTVLILNLEPYITARPVDDEGALAVARQKRQVDREAQAKAASSAEYSVTAGQHESYLLPFSYDVVRLWTMAERQPHSEASLARAATTHIRVLDEYCELDPVFTAGALLCGIRETSRSIVLSAMVSSHPGSGLPARITCRKCLKLAARWHRPSH
jgi:hypothetical protein